MAACAPSALSDEERFPYLFHQTDIDPAARKRTAKMEILIIGMMRTGTTSIALALQELGYKDYYHMNSVMKNPADSEWWVRALNAKYFGEGQKFTRKEWDHLLSNAQFCLDLPAAAFMPDLIEAYPEAKVIVCERDPDRWYASVRDSILKTFDWHIPILMFLDKFFIGRFFPSCGRCMTAIFGKDGLFGDPEHLKKVYHAMHEEVRQITPQDRLLDYQLGDGWEPLCKFLGKDIPDKPFPHVNDAKELLYRHEVLKRLAVKRILKNIVPWFGVAAASGALAWWLWWN